MEHHNPELDLHDDDKPVGRLLTRREILALLGGGTAAAMVGVGFTRLGLSPLAAQGTATPTLTRTPPATLPACVVRPELTEGPYFVDGMLNRSDIRIDPTDESIKEGVLLKLIFRVSEINADACTALEGAQVDVWHCDAEGVYSGVTDPGFDTSEQLWLRGYQITDEFGVAEFVTVYPGWYSGRAVHIHFKIRLNSDTEQAYEFTSQFFFDEELTDEIHEIAPYNAKGYRNTLNETDNIFQQSEGLLTLDVVENEDEEIGGYVAIFEIGLDLTDTEVGASDAAGGGGGQGGPGGGNPPGGAPPNGGTPRPR